MRVLIAEDDDSVATALHSALARAGHVCVRTTRGADVLLRHRETELVLLDLGLADMDGLEMLRQLRAVSDVPVVVVTARGDERSTVRALTLGADDYLVKPVRLQELLARILAATRRHQPTRPADAIRVGGLEIDIPARRVHFDAEEVSLTPTEFDVLSCLAARPGRAVSRQEILDQVWGDAYATSSRAFDVHLGQLRHKLPTVKITTIRGFGYRLESAE